MDKNKRARLGVAALIYCMVNAVVFGVGTILVVSLPALMSHAFFWMPALVAASFVISAPLDDRLFSVFIIGHLDSAR